MKHAEDMGTGCERLIACDIESIDGECTEVRCDHGPKICLADEFVLRSPFIRYEIDGAGDQGDQNGNCVQPADQRDVRNAHWDSFSSYWAFGASMMSRR